MQISCRLAVSHPPVADQKQFLATPQLLMTPLSDLCCSCAAARASIRWKASCANDRPKSFVSSRKRHLPIPDAVVWGKNRRLVCLGSRFNEISAAASSSQQTKEGTTRTSDFVSPSVVTEEAQQVLYEVHLSTSYNPGSGLTQPDASILLALIGEDGRSTLFRAASVVSEDMASRVGTEVGDSSDLTAAKVTGGRFVSPRFQRGAVDTVTFTGQDVQPLAAMWLAPEAGSWRPMEAFVAVHSTMSEQAHDGRGALSEASTSQEDGGVSSSDVPGQQTAFPSQQGALPCQQPAAFYVFRNSYELLLGDGGNAPALQMRPDVSTAAEMAASRPVEGGPRREEVRAEGLAEYEELKWWLLKTTGLLGALGAALAGTVWGEGAAWSFGTGAVAAVLYLLLLQLSADSVPGPSPMEPSAGARGVQSGERLLTGREAGLEREREVGEARQMPEASPGGFRFPSNTASRVLVLVLLFAVALQAAERMGWGSLQGGALPPQALFVGILGFFTYKISVFLAAFRPGLDPTKLGK